MDIGATLNRGRNAIRRGGLPYMYLAPAFIVMGVITFYPLIYQLIISFSDFQTKDLLGGLASTKLHWIGIQNYIDIFTGGLPVQNFEFFRVLTYNFWWAITNVAVHVPAGIIIAVILNIPGIWFKRFYRAIYVLPVVIPPLVVATVWRNIFDEQYGAMNQFLSAITHLFGTIDPVRIRWLFEYKPPIPWLCPICALFEPMQTAGLLYILHADGSLFVDGFHSQLGADSKRVSRYAFSK